MDHKKKSANSDSYAKKTNNLLSEILRPLEIRDKLILKLIYEANLSSNEISFLKYSDFTFSKNQLKIRAETTKNNKTRTINISEELIAEIKAFGNRNSRYLFSTNKSPRIRTRTIRLLFERISKDLGRPITSKDLARGTL